jgi:hypothetical protein
MICSPVSLPEPCAILVKHMKVCRVRYQMHLLARRTAWLSANFSQQGLAAGKPHMGKALFTQSLNKIDHADKA